MDPPTRQAAAVPFRRQEGQALFCLITTADGSRWGIPKGMIDAGDTPVQTALKEAHEEAGLHGRVVGDPVGCYLYAKWGRTFTVDVFLMEVTGEDDHWEEMAFRERRWCDGATALELVGSRPVTEVLRMAIATVE